jgi:hypothetical protein
MKKINLVVAIAIIMLAFGFTACKKVADANDGIADGSTLKITTQSTISDNLNEDANNVFAQTVYDTTTLGASRPAPYYNAVITINGSVFPKTVTIDFGTGTTSQDGIVRSGKIIAVLSDSFYKAGSMDTLTFNNYVVAGYQKEGTIVWTNQSHKDTLAWTRVDSGTVTAPGGAYWHHLGSIGVIQTAGIGDFDLSNNVYSITGSRTITNSDGVSATSTVLPITPLEKKASCPYIDKGQLVIGITNTSHSVLIDFGNGDCDATASYSYDHGAFHDFQF